MLLKARALQLSILAIFHFIFVAGTVAVAVDILIGCFNGFDEYIRADRIFTITFEIHTKYGIETLLALQNIICSTVCESKLTHIAFFGHFFFFQQTQMNVHRTRCIMLGGALQF